MGAVTTASTSPRRPSMAASSSEAAAARHRYNRVGDQAARTSTSARATSAPTNPTQDRSDSLHVRRSHPKQHPADQWYWVALVYDDKKMLSYVNGKKELEGIVDFPPMTSGDISIGVRLNKVNWFKGLIKEIRFHPAALDSLTLQH